MQTRRLVALVVALAILASVVGSVPRAALANTPTPAVAFAPIGTYNTGLGSASAETVAYSRDRMYVTNTAGNSLDIVDLTNAAAPARLQRIDLSPYGAGPNSVAVRGNLVAVAVEASPKTNPGKVVLFNSQGRFLNQFTVGALPDMLTFSPKGDFILVANEGEPNSYGQPDSVDPEGSVSIIPIWQGATRLPQANIKTAGFNKFERGGECADDIDPRVRIFGPTAGQDNPRRISQNLEPEYITFSPDGRFAYVTLQENNALGILDMQYEEFVKIVYLGEKDHSLPGNGLDASDRDSAININNWPVSGLYQPDAIASFRVGGKTYLITANEGDARDYTGFAEEARVGSLSLDPAAFPNAAALKANSALGRLTVTNQNGDTDGDGDFDKLYPFGARSFTIWNDSAQVVYDSGDLLEQITANTYPAFFNSDGPGTTFDSRSDNKGPEPEAVDVGRIGNRTYAFIGLERIGGVMIFDVTNPAAPVFVQYTNNADFVRGTGDRGPEVVVFIAANESPTRRARFLVANEISGTVTVYEQTDPNGAGTLTLLHNNDGESSLLPTNVTTGGVTLPTAGVSAFKTVTDREVADARARGNAVVNVYAGDAFLASSTLACSLPPNPPTTPVYDAVAQRQIQYDAHIFGNHEFDFAPDFLERFVRGFAINGRLTQPFLSANLDFSNEPGFADLIKAGGLIVGRTGDGEVVARSLIIADKVNGQVFGIVSATTPALPTISSPRNVIVTSNDDASTAAVVQAEVDRLTNSYGVKKIIFVSHLQAVANDRALARLLRNVDIAVAGGGDDLLINDPATLLPGDAPTTIVGPYPIVETDANGQPVYIVTTSGNYKYLGRIDARFDADGRVASIVAEQSFPRRVVPTSAGATALGIGDAVALDPGIESSVIQPVTACLAALSNPIARTEVALNVARGTFSGGVASRGVRSTETNGGNLVADSFVAAYDRYAAGFGLPARGPGNLVIAVQNGGGIRQNAGDVLPVGGAVPGNITRRNTLDVLAFFTNITSVVNDVTPAELEAILERSGSLPGGGQFLQVAGLSVTYDLSQQAQVVGPPPPGEQAGTITTPGARVREVVYTAGTADPSDDVVLITGGAPVAGAPTVRIVTNSFTAAGGDNYPTFEDIPTARKVQLPATYEQALVEYLLAFPSASGLPTIPASDARYVPNVNQRIFGIPTAP